jgi:hypothetical protein
MAQPVPRGPEDRPAGGRDRGWTRWLAAGTFVLGLVAGVLLVGLLGQDSPVATTAQATESGPVAGPTGPAEPPGGVAVNEACLRAINAARDIAATVDDLGAAAAALDAAQLDEVIRRLQPLQDRLRASSAACEATGSVPATTGAPTPTAPPTGATPPASPTG